MKKSILTLGLLGLAGGAFAQTLNGPWTEVNQAPYNSSPASFAVDQLVTLSRDFSWGIAYDATSAAASPPKNNSMRVVPPPTGSGAAAGTTFDFQSIVGTAGYQPTNISVPFGAAGDNTAFCGQYATGAMNGGGGEVIRTTNGGATWRKISNAQMFGQPDGFCNWAYAFDQNTVVTGGDPNPLPAGGGAGQFEFWYTTNATVAAPTWTRCTGMPAPLSASEYALVGSYFAIGNTIWAGTSNEPNGTPGPARVLRSTNRGVTWTVANTPMTGSVQNIAFKDANNGVAYSRSATGYQLMYTTDGGLTWTLQAAADTQNPATADTVTYGGKFYQYGISAIPGKGFMSYGAAISGITRIHNFGASYSVTGHGKTWTDVDKGRATYISADFLSATPIPGNAIGYVGYLGGFTRPASLTTQGGDGGIYQVNYILATRNAALQRSLTVSPNPSNTGIFQLDLTDGIKAGTMLTVFDALGRQVLSRELSATTAAAKTVKVDLSKEKTGVYTLRLTTEAGIATAKLVIE